MPCVQGGTGQTPESVKPSKTADTLEPQEPVFSMPENQSEPSPPPSRILRSGKRVPIGTAARAPPRTASKASRVAVPASDEETSAQACLFTTNRCLEPLTQHQYLHSHATFIVAAEA